MDTRVACRVHSQLRVKFALTVSIYPMSFDKLRLFTLNRIIAGVIPIVVGWFTLRLGIEAGQGRSVALGVGLICTGISGVLRPMKRPRLNLRSPELARLQLEDEEAINRATIGPRSFALAMEKIGLVVMMVSAVMTLFGPR
jgi:hypothetical protein